MKKHRLFIISTCPVGWAGSEELWSGAAKSLLKKGHSVRVLKAGINWGQPQIKQLQLLGCSLKDFLLVRWSLIVRLSNLITPNCYQVQPKHMHLAYAAMQLKLHQPDMVIISQGDAYEGLHFAKLCKLLHIPYVLLTQKVVDYDWPPDNRRASMRQAFEQAVKCFFVSHHNKRAVEGQIISPLVNSEVIWNPFTVTNTGPLPWPVREKDHFYLACVARLYVKDKGQDMLLQVLSLKKWKERKLYVTFVGEGTNREGLAGLAMQLQITNVCFVGHVSDIASIWREHHALIMPSRSEGLPLSLVEAMMCGRPAIVTNVGGSPDIVQDEVTGFVAAPSVKDLDDALERAWQHKDKWHQMGELAANNIRSLVPSDPSSIFAEKLISISI